MPSGWGRPGEHAGDGVGKACCSRTTQTSRGPCPLSLSATRTSGTGPALCPQTSRRRGAAVFAPPSHRGTSPTTTGGNQCKTGTPPPVPGTEPPRRSARRTGEAPGPSPPHHHHRRRGRRWRGSPASSAVAPPGCAPCSARHSTGPPPTSRGRTGSPGDGGRSASWPLVVTRPG